METGAITQYIDVAQIVLYVFWIFFFTLIFWLHRESKREGYPLEPDVGGGRMKQGFPAVPPQKTFAMAGGVTLSPEARKDEPPLAAHRTAVSAGSPYEPEGDGMGAGVGPGAWAMRADVPDAMFDGTPRLRPLRILTDYHVEARDPDPRGREVVGCDGVSGGRIVDVWADRAESFLRYYEFEREDGSHGLVPVTFTQLPMTNPMLAPAKRDPGPVRVNSIKGEHFANVPGTASPDVVTLLEEEKIQAYYGGGYLYADPARQEPLL
jgi:photosynthetic reaction center H subunit